MTKNSQFPSDLPDEYITPHGFKATVSGPEGFLGPTYKRISHHYFKLRLLQSEILQVIQQQQKPMSQYPSYHPFHLRAPHLQNFANLREWHTDVTKRLDKWIDAAPRSEAETGVNFSFELFELNYWQTRLMLYRHCLSSLSGELGGGRGIMDSRGKEVSFGQLRGGNNTNMDDEDEKTYLIIAQAGREVLMLYRKLHREHRVNYTFLSTHNLFLSGI